MKERAPPDSRERSPPQRMSDAELHALIAVCQAELGRRALGSSVAPPEREVLAMAHKVQDAAKSTPPVPPEPIVFASSGKGIFRGEVVKPRMSAKSKSDLAKMLEYLSQQGVSERDLRAIRRIYGKGFAISSIVPNSSAAPSRLARKSRRRRKYGDNAIK